MFFQDLASMYNILVNLNVPEKVDIANSAWQDQVRSDTEHSMKPADTYNNTEQKPENLL